MDKEIIDLLKSIDDRLSILCNHASLQHEMLAEWKWKDEEVGRIRRFEDRGKRSLNTEIHQGSW